MSRPGNKRPNLQARLAVLEAGATGHAGADVTPEQQAQIREVIAWMRAPEQDRPPLRPGLEEMLAAVLEAREAF